MNLGSLHPCLLWGPGAEPLAVFFGVDGVRSGTRSSEVAHRHPVHGVRRTWRRLPTRGASGYGTVRSTLAHGHTSRRSPRDPVTNVSDSGARRTGPALEAMYQLVKWLIPALDRFPRRQKFLLGDRIQSTALAGLETLVEATFTHSRGPLLERANVDLDKLRLLMRLSKELGYLDARRYEHAARRIDEVGRLVGGWKRAHHDAAD